ncbi:caspase domain-containing protein [Lactarius quietus]|nr:caspase domain-containing protein [Lactarius quietus]
MPISHGHRSRSHSHSSSHRSGHSHSRRSSSQVPSPAPSPGFRPSPSPSPVVTIIAPSQIHTLAITSTINSTLTGLVPLRVIVIRAPTLMSTSTGGMASPRRNSHTLLALTARRLPPRRYRHSLLAQELNAPNTTSDGRHSHPLFRHSRCTGKRKAVCVGINYTGQQNELQGCVNDARNMYQFLMENYRYSHSNIIVLTDDNTIPRNQPTRKNMLNAMRWLVEDASPDDALFIHYSGHGGRTRDLDGDEVDGWDEGNTLHSVLIFFPGLKKTKVIFPVDYKTTGIITDDELHKALVEPLPPGCRLTGVFDSCHSASILEDLPFEYHSNGQLKSSPVTPAFINAKASPADVISFSGSMDTQTSADVVQNGVAVGAMSYALLKVLKRNSRISHLEVLRGVRWVVSYDSATQVSALMWPIPAEQS